jgi:hypothetical protein
MSPYGAPRNELIVSRSRVAVTPSARFFLGESATQKRLTSSTCSCAQHPVTDADLQIVSDWIEFSDRNVPRFYQTLTAGAKPGSKVKIKLILKIRNAHPYMDHKVCQA